MTAKEISKATVLAVLQPHLQGDAVMRRCYDALQGDSRDVFDVGASHADALRKTLEVKYSIARQHGKTIEGDADLLLKLSDLDKQLVTFIYATEEAALFQVFLTWSPLAPVGAMIMRQ